MAKKKTAKKTEKAGPVKKPVRVGSSRRTTGSFGSARSTVAYKKSEKGNAYHDIKNETGANILVFADTGISYVHVHYVNTEQGREACVCGIHRLVEGGQDGQRVIDVIADESEAKAIKGWDSDGCKICSYRSAMYEQLKDDPAFDKSSKGKIFRDIAYKEGGTKCGYVMIAAKGAFNQQHTKDGLVVVAPVFPEGSLQDVRYLNMSPNTYGHLVKALDSQKINSADFAGVPVNFMRGVPESGGFNQVIGVDLFPKKRVPISDFGNSNDWPDFSDVGVYDGKKMEDVHAAWLDFIPKRLAGKKVVDGEEKSGKKKAGKKVGKKKASSS